MSVSSKPKSYIPNKILIVGLARNLEKQLVRNVNLLRRAFVSVPKIHWLIVESDSADRTVQVLQRLSQQVSDFHVEFLGCLAKTIPDRVDRITACRNHALHVFEKMHAQEKFDLVVVADLDDANVKISAQGIETCWVREDWDALFANQSGPYYDIFALRHPDWCSGDCWKEYRFLLSHGHQKDVAKYVAIISKMIVLPQTSDWLEVQSAFGGLAIYKADVIQGHRYESHDQNNRPVCEHVTLHQSLVKSGARLFINPKLINSDFTSHTTVTLYSRHILRIIRICMRFFSGILTNHSVREKVLNRLVAESDGLKN